MPRSLKSRTLQPWDSIKQNKFNQDKSQSVKTSMGARTCRIYPVMLASSQKTNNML